MSLWPPHYMEYVGTNGVMERNVSTTNWSYTTYEFVMEQTDTFHPHHLAGTRLLGATHLKKKKKNYQPWTCTETQSQQETSPSVSSLSRWVLWQLLFWSNLRRSERSVCVCVRVRGVPSACVWQRRHHLQQWVWAACTSLQRTDGPAGGQPRRVQ